MWLPEGGCGFVGSSSGKLDWKWLLPESSRCQGFLAEQGQNNSLGLWSLNELDMWGSPPRGSFGLPFPVTELSSVELHGLVCRQSYWVVAGFRSPSWECFLRQTWSGLSWGLADHERSIFSHLTSLIWDGSASPITNCSLSLARIPYSHLQKEEQSFSPICRVAPIGGSEYFLRASLGRLAGWAGGQ